MIKKFSLIVEDITEELKMNPKESLEEILSHMRDEEPSFRDYIMEYLDEDEYDEWLLEYDNSNGYEELKEVMGKYNCLSKSSEHVYFHILYLQSFVDKITGKTLNKINN